MNIILCFFFFYPSTLCEIFNKQYLERGPRYAKHNEQQLVAAERAQGLISGPEHAKAPHACKSVPFEKCLQKYLVRCPPIKRTKINMSPFIAAGSADTAARVFFFFLMCFWTPVNVRGRAAPLILHSPHAGNSEILTSDLGKNGSNGRSGRTFCSEDQEESLSPELPDSMPR